MPRLSTHLLVHKALCAITPFFLLCSLSLSAQNIEYTREDSTKVVKILKDASLLPVTENAVIHFALQFIGAPYVAHTLELGNQEHLIVNLRQFDCSTYVETVSALVLCHYHDHRTFSDFCHYLTLLRYRQGQLTDYTSRLHYFTWWATDNVNLGLVSDIAPTSAPWEPFTATQTININYMSTHPFSYKQLRLHPEHTAVIQHMEQASQGQRYRYIPKSQLDGTPQGPLSVIHSGDIVAMLTDSDGLDTRHVGFAIWRDDHLHILHASSLHKRVLISHETFYDYEKKQIKHTGIRVMRIKK